MPPEKTLQEKLRERADWYRGINRAVKDPRPKHDLETADLLEAAARTLDFKDGIRR